MKILSVFVILASMSVAQASILAECQSRNVNITVFSGKNAREAILNINGVETLAKRRMDSGIVSYKAASVQFAILGNHRQMGNPIGYLDRKNAKRSSVVCTQGVDVEKVAEATELY